MKAIIRKRLANAKRRIEHRLRPIPWEEQPNPMFSASNIQYEIAERSRGLPVGGIGAIHLVAQKSGWVALLACPAVLFEPGAMPTLAWACSATSGNMPMTSVGMAPGKTAGVTLARVYPASIGFRLLVGLLDAAPQTCKHGGDVEPYLRAVGAEDHVVRFPTVLPQPLHLYGLSQVAQQIVLI